VEAGERDMTLATMRGMCDLMKKETARLKESFLVKSTDGYCRILLWLLNVAYRPDSIRSTAAFTLPSANRTTESTDCELKTHNTHAQRERERETLGW
jgi:hypothetical protein